MFESPSDRGSVSRGYAIAAASAVILSTTGIIIRHLVVTYQVPPLVLAFWRNALVVVILAPALTLIRPQRLYVAAVHLPYLVGYGAVLAVFNVLWTNSVALCGAAVATVLVYTSCASSALLGFWFLKEQLNRTKMAAIALCLAGCALVSGAFQADWSGSLVGAVAGMLSGVCYAAYSVMGRVAAGRNLNAWSTVLFTFGFAALFQLAGVLAAGVLDLQIAPHPSDLLWLGSATSGWAMLCLLSAGPTLVGFGLYNLSLESLPASVVNLIVTLEPACTAAIAYALLGERLSTMEISGSLVILVGVLVLRLGEPKGGTENPRLEHADHRVRPTTPTAASCRSR